MAVLQYHISISRFRLLTRVAFLLALCVSAFGGSSSQPSPTRITDRPWEEEIFYQIYLANFFNGDTTNDIMLDKYGDELGVDSNGVDHGGYLGGDLAGVVQKLDYLSTLGITTIFLSPIIQNDQDSFFGYYASGYRPKDYFTIDENLGTTGTLIQLINEAHARDMRVLIDMPLALCGIENPLNTPANAAAGYFNGTAWGMPAWNADNEFVADYLTSVGLFWRDMSGCDGLRLDSAHLLSTGFWTDFAAAVDVQTDPDDLFLMAEITSSPAEIGSFLTQTGFDSAYDFTFLACQDVFGKGLSVNRLNTAIRQAQLNYPEPTRTCSEIDNYWITFVSQSLAPVLDRTKLALAFLMTMDRIPILYAGDEIGYWNGVPGDIFDPAHGEPSLFPYLKQLIALRKDQPALRHGAYTRIQNANPLFAYTRSSEDSTILVVINNSDTATSVTYSNLAAPWNSLELTDLLRDEVVKPAQSDAPVSVPPYSAVILQVCVKCSVVCWPLY